MCTVRSETDRGDFSEGLGRRGIGGRNCEGPGAQEQSQEHIVQESVEGCKSTVHEGGGGTIEHHGTEQEQVQLLDRVNMPTVRLQRQVQRPTVQLRRGPVTMRRQKTPEVAKLPRNWVQDRTEKTMDLPGPSEKDWRRSSLSISRARSSQRNWWSQSAVAHESCTASNSNWQGRQCKRERGRRRRKGRELKRRERAGRKDRGKKG